MKTKILLGTALAVCLVLASALGGNPARAQEAEGVYIVRPGDTLSRIAWQHNVPLLELVHLNKIANPNLIRVGQRILLPDKDDEVRAASAGCAWVLAKVGAYNSRPSQTQGDPYMTASGYYLKNPDGTLVPEAVIAAPVQYAFGTRIYVPGYGWAVVRDRGRVVVGNVFDVWMHSLQDAKTWGVPHLRVQIC